MKLLPSNTQLGKLEVLEVFEHYDFPRIFSCKSNSGQIFVVLSIHDDEHLCEWIYLPVSLNRYKTLCEGTMDLHSGITRPEDGFIHLVKTFQDRDAEISYVFAEQISKDDLPSDGYKLSSVREAIETEFDIGVDRVAKSTRREAFNIHIFPAGQRAHEVSARKLGSILFTSQELIDAIGQATDGNPTVRGAIPAEILSKTKVNVCHTFKGSFGVQFQASGQADLFDNSLVADALEEFGNLVLAEDIEDRLSNKLHSLRGRVASKYRRLLKELHDLDSGLRLDWGSVGINRGGVFELTKEQVSNAYAIVDKIDIDMAEEVIVYGRLVGFNSRTKRYEISVDDDKKNYSGKVSEEATISVAHPAIGSNYYASLRMLVETQSSSGDELVRWIMVALNESDPSGKSA